MKILGLDVGEKRIGVAKVDSDTRIAVPIGFISVDGSEWQEIAHLASLNGTNLFVLGLPRSNEGNETKQSVYVRNFAKILAQKIPGAKIRFQDESLTSVVAEERLKSRKKHYEKGEIDAEAACIILEDFTENFKAPAINKPAETTKIQKEVKKVKRKTKRITKVISGVAVFVILALIGVAVALFIRDERYRQYAEYFQQKESEMNALTFDFTIRPGETIYDVKKHLLSVDRNGGKTPDEPLPNYTASEIDAAFNASYDYEFLKERPEGATLEGFLFPETHNFYGDSSVEDILKVFLKKTDEVIRENNLKQKFSDQGLSIFEGFTLASVVQKEAYSPDQPTVAQVFLSRLSLGIPLGSDVTVSYALDTVDPDRQIYTDNQAALRVDSCYNTRLYGGLPCGPISNPGLSALQAVANPSDSSYLYFLTGDDGMMYYSYTESEHIQNIYSHCQELCNTALWQNVKE